MNSANTVYYLTADIINSGASTCMTFSANNIILDCQGHRVDGIQTWGTTGLDNNAHNTTIYNCSVTDWYYGLHSYGTNYFKYENLYFNNPSSFWDIAYGNALYGYSKNITVNNVIDCFGITGFDYFENISGTIHCTHDSISYHFGNNTFKYIKGSLSVDGRNTTITDSNLTYLKHGNEGNLRSLITRVNITGTVSLSGNLTFYNNIWVSPTDCTHPECIYQAMGNPNSQWNTTLTSGTNIIQGSLIGGNYYTSLNGLGWSDMFCIDNNLDYICDYPLPLSKTGNVFNYDNYPLVKNIPPPPTTTTTLQAHPPDITYNSSCSAVSYPNTLSLTKVSSALLKNETIDWQPHYIVDPTSCACYITTYFRFSESRDNYYLNNNTHIYKYDKNWNLVGTIIIDNANTYDVDYFWLFPNQPCDEPSCGCISHVSEFTKFVHTDDNYHWAIRVGHEQGYYDTAVIFQQYYGIGNSWNHLEGEWYFYWSSPPLSQDSISVKSFYDGGDINTFPYKDRHFWNWWFWQGSGATELETFNRSTTLGIMRGTQRLYVPSSMTRNSTHFFHLWNDELHILNYSLDNFSTSYNYCCPPSPPLNISFYKVKNYNNEPISSHSGMTCVSDTECYIASPFNVGGENGILMMKFNSSDLNVVGNTLYADKEQFIPNCYLNLNNNSVQEIWLTNHGNNMEMIFSQNNSVYHLETGTPLPPSGFYCGQIGVCTANIMCFITSILKSTITLILCVQPIFIVILLGGIGMAILFGMKSLSKRF
jgi:hypothetical protein